MDMRGANKNFIPLTMSTCSNLKIFKPIINVIVVSVSLLSKIYSVNKRNLYTKVLDRRKKRNPHPGLSEFKIEIITK